MIIWDTGNGIAVSSIADGDLETVISEMQAEHPNWVVLSTADLELPEDAISFDEVSFNQDAQILEMDIAKVRETTKRRLRRERKPFLDALDVQFMRALEQGQSTTEIVAEKQRLRDITELDSISTVHELRAITCEV